jgi:hypothetical protein
MFMRHTRVDRSRVLNIRTRDGYGMPAATGAQSTFADHRLLGTVYFRRRLDHSVDYSECTKPGRSYKWAIPIQYNLRTAVIGWKNPNHSILLFLKKESTVFWDSSCFKFPMPPRVFFKPFRCSWLFTAFTTSDKFKSFGIGGISADLGEMGAGCCGVAELGEA